MISTFLNYLSIGKKPGKIPELDGIRALAILMVLGHHFATFYSENHRSYYRQVISGPIENWLLNGWLGVDLFFVLSGYLIFRHLLCIQQKPIQNKAYARYAFKRILRTFPLYYAMIILGFFGLIPFFNPDITWTKFFQHVFFLQDYTANHILTPMWSLATEEKFYLLAPMLLLLVSRWTIKRSLVLLAVTIIAITSLRYVQTFSSESISSHIQFFTSYRAPFHFAIASILVGVMVALIESVQTPKQLPKVLLITSVLLIVCLCTFNLYRVDNWSALGVIHMMLVVLFGVVIASLVKLTGSKWLGFLRGRFLRVVAVLSYSLYLVHYAVLPWAFRLHKQHIMSETSWIHSLSFLAFYLGITLAVSLLLHYVVEKPFLTLKNRIN